MSKILMIQGAGSNVGKSMIVAGLARACRKRGIAVAPFKPQNMSNNAAVTVDGGEIGRAQALQARAAGLEPVIDMNPVLLKPETDTGAQVIVHGRRHATLSARDYTRVKDTLMQPVMDSFRRLAKRFELVLIEGAGSPAETNLRRGDIANMGFAQAADCPVVLVGDIDRGGVIAQMVGTHAVLSDSDRNLVRAFIINKFRGDPHLFSGGMKEISQRTGWAALGILPWFDDAWRLPGEDVMDLAARPGGTVRIAVPQLGRLANFDDLDPLAGEPGVRLDIVPPGRPLPGDAALVLLAGSKSTIADLAALRENGWDIDLLAHHRRGGQVLGICAGYQMLGRQIHDPDGVEGPPGSVAGLGLLDVETTLGRRKRLALSNARCLENGETVTGYEIHLGNTGGADCANGWLMLDGQLHGARSACGRVRGCYLHGLFAADGFREAFLADLGVPAAGLHHEATVENTLDALACHLENNLDLDAILDLAARA